MRSLAPYETSRAPVRDRKIFSTILLISAASCVAMSAFHIEFSSSAVASFVMRSGTKLMDPLVATIRRRTSW